ncbi:MAG: efflux RND transporter periplasmic adaptor subunit [Woeseiaceae bacterium]
MKKMTLSVVLLLLVNTSIYAEEFAAVLKWSKRVELSTPVSGLVQKVFAVTGDVVAKGNVLVQLDPRSFKANLKYTKARLKNTDEQTLEAKRELDRQLDMYDRSMLSDHDLQVSKNNFMSSRSGYLQAQAELTKAKLDLEYSAIRAPFNAIIINSSAVKGQVVASEIIPTVLVVVAEANRMLARFYASNSIVSELTLNQGVKVKISGESYQGKVLKVALELEPNQSGYAVDIIFDSKEKVLRAGQKVTIDL